MTVASAPELIAAQDEQASFDARLSPRASVQEAGERRWVLGFAALLLALTSLPYLLGYAVQGSDWRFSGFVFGVEDGHSYIAKMLSGSAGAWLFHTPYTAAPQRGAFMYLPYLLLGKLAAPPGLHDQLVALFHLFRLAAGGLMCLATYDFLAFFVQEVRLRRWGLALAAVGGGLGWALAVAGQNQWLDSLPLDLYSPESFGFLALYGLPHLAAARALLLWALLAYLQAGQRMVSPSAADGQNGGGLLARFRLSRTEAFSAIRASILWLLAGLFQPLVVAVIGAVILLHLLALGVAGALRKGPTPSPARLLSWAALAGLAPALFLAYNLWTYAADPFLRAWTSQNILPSPHPAHYLAAYGLLAPFAFWGSRRLLKRGSSNAGAFASLFLTCWVLALPLLAYAPVNIQRRLPEGVWVALVALALAGVERRARNDSRAGQTARAAFWGASLLALPSTFLLLASGLLGANRPALPLFRPAQETEAFLFLQQTAEPGAVVLGSYATANALPAWAPVRVVAGHGPESAGLAGLLPQIERFYSAGTLPADRQALAQAWQLDYVFWGPEERRLGNWKPDGSAGYELVYHSGDWSIFAVDRAAAHP